MNAGAFHDALRPVREFFAEQAWGSGTVEEWELAAARSLAASRLRRWRDWRHDRRRALASAACLVAVSPFAVAAARALAAT